MAVLLSEYRVLRQPVPCQNLTIMTQNLVKDLEDLAEDESPTDFVSALDTYLQRYVKEDKDLDELAKHWDFGMLAERSSKKPGYIVKRHFKLSEAAERGRRVCGVEEMTQKGVFGKRQKRNPQCEQVGKLYQLAGAKWLSLRMKELKADEADDKRDWDWWFQKEVEVAFKHLPEEAPSSVSDESEIGASKRRKTAATNLEAAESLVALTEDDASSGIVTVLAPTADNISALTDASIASTTSGTAVPVVASDERDGVSTQTEASSADTGKTRLPAEISLASSETPTSSKLKDLEPAPRHSCWACRKEDVFGSTVVMLTACV